MPECLNETTIDKKHITNNKRIKYARVSLPTGHICKYLLTKNVC